MERPLTNHKALRDGGHWSFSDSGCLWVLETEEGHGEGRASVGCAQPLESKFFLQVILSIRWTFKTKVKRAGLQVVWAEQLPKRRYRTRYLRVPWRGCLGKQAEGTQPSYWWWPWVTFLTTTTMTLEGLLCVERWVLEFICIISSPTSTLQCRGAISPLYRWEGKLTRLSNFP